MVGQGRRRRTSRILRALLLAVLVGPAAGVPAAQAAISVGNVSITETDDADVVASFEITRTAGILTGNATVAFSTADGTARSPADYTPLTGSLFFGSLPLGGVQTQSVQVAVRPDALDEPDETLRMLLSGSAEIVDGEGVGMIIDDDPPPVVGVLDAPATAEGATATFTVSLSTPSGRDVSVGYTTADGSAVAGADYAPAGGAVVIPAGATTTSIGVAVLDDGADEPDESFELRLGSPAFATVGRAAAAATIVDDDEPPPPPPVASPAGEPTLPAADAPAVPAADPSPGAAADGGPAPAGASMKPQLGLSSPRLRRPAVILVTVACPRSTSRCSGRVTIFSRPNPRSRIKALRRERRLGQRNFTLLSGKTRTLTIGLAKRDRVLLLRAGRLLVRAYAVTRDGNGRTSVRRSSGTLIARTSHS